MNSLRSRLFVILVAATGLIWFFAAGWIYVGAKQEVETVLDARLQEAARMVSSLVPNGMPSAGQGPTSNHVVDIPSYERQLSCQIWSLDGQLVAKSSGAPATKFSDTRAGFSERKIDGETWRVYTIEDHAKGIRVLVGDRLSLRDHLVAELIKGLLAPTLLMIPLLGFLIWVSLDRGLRPLRLMADGLQARDADDMSPVDVGPLPKEIHPVVTSMNSLFAKVQAARQHEREITAFAAHELRTPLAGLKMQAQISMAASDKPTRDAALRQIVIAVDRTTRLVRQLLTVAKLDAVQQAEPNADINAGAVVDEIVSALPATSAGIQVVVDPSLRRTVINTNRELLTLAIRNLHENALHHMPETGVIRWSAATTSDELAIFAEDEGPGIPSDELALATNRFFRGRHKSTVGSGLGLSIVDLAVRTSGARLSLQNRSDRSGLRAQIIWPISRAVGQSDSSGEYIHDSATLRLKAAS
ncbi:ATP-binding protein [Bradyrhizobium sp. SYSU BS000235]|uniref:ATP-binding protein n=1 Tax=Bradyrhizobium sp. SYSU BS000235 TaxID=3411332 RepID=UPI003C78B5F9